MSGAAGARRKRPTRFVIPAGNARIDVPDRTFGIPSVLGSSGAKLRRSARCRELLLADGFVIASRWCQGTSGLHRVRPAHGARSRWAARYVLRRLTPGERTEIDDVVWGEEERLSFRRSLGTSVISEVVIGMGASIGRENAPKLMGGASASLLAGWARLSPAQRRLLMACGGGAGLAAVYNVPLGGALFTAEIMMGTVTLPVALPALACSGIATATAWLYLPRYATYLGVPSYPFTVPLLVWALLAGPLIGLVASGYIRLIGWVTHHATAGRAAVFASVAAFGILGLVGFATRSCSATARTWRMTPSSARPGSRSCCRFSLSSRWSPRCAWAAGRPAACSRPRSARGPCSAPRASRGAWPGQGRRRAPTRSWARRRCSAPPGRRR